MENKQYILILIALLVLVGLGFYFVTSNSDSTPLQPENVNTNTRGQPLVMEDTSPAMDGKVMSPEFSLFIERAPEGSMVYEITSGSASYTAQKRFLQKEDSVITGTTDVVSGYGWIVKETGALNLHAEVDLVALATDSEQRDKDVQAMLEDKMGKLDLELASSNIVDGETFSLETPATLIINGFEREVTVAIEGTVAEEDFDATGSFTILMSDFGVTPPSLAGVFTVDDEIVINFEVSGDLLQDEAAMEETEQDTMMEVTN